MAAATSVHVVAIVEPIIQHADWFFPEGGLCSSSHSHLVVCPLFCEGFIHLRTKNILHFIDGNKYLRLSFTVYVNKL